MARNIYHKQRNYLHPIDKSPKFKTSDFQKKEEGTLADGTRITSFEAVNPAIPRGFKYGIQVSPPGNQPPMLVFGSYQEIGDASQAIKADVDAFVQTLRPKGKSQFYSLNDHAPGETQMHQDTEEFERYEASRKVFPNQGRDDQLLSNEQIERRALRDHERKLAEFKVMYPTSVEGTAQVEEILKPKPSGPPSILFDEEAL